MFYLFVGFSDCGIGSNAHPCIEKGNTTCLVPPLEGKAPYHTRERRPGNYRAESIAPLICTVRLPVIQNSSFAYVTMRNAAAVIGTSDAGRISRINPEGRVFVPLPLNHTYPPPHHQTKELGHLSVSEIPLSPGIS